MNHVRSLLELISHFPRINPSASPSASPPSAAESTTDVDIPKLFRQIRSRYKLLCASLAIRPSLRATEGDEGNTPAQVPDGESENVTGVQTKTKKSVWKLDGGGTPKGSAPQGLSF